MRDRISKYPGRVQLIPVEGQPGYYDVVRADEPEEEGMPLNKANLLTDETADLYNLGVEATLNEAFANVPVLITKGKPTTFEKLLTGRLI